MIYEDIQVSGSISISGSFNVPKHASTASANQATGSLFFDTSAKLFKVFQSGAGALNVASQPFTPTPPAAKGNIEYLVIGGGGSGGQLGGGGAGGHLSGSLANVTSGSSLTVTIGGGGAPITSVVRGNTGTNSSIAGTGYTTATALGGGGGGGQGAASDAGYGKDGGSGGGGGENDSGYNTPGNGTAGQGNDGGTGGTGAGTQLSGGGGGGAGAAGSNAAGQSSGGAGGNGLANNITGTSVSRAGGGGGGAWWYNNGGSSYGGAGGSGGGGAAGTTGNTAAVSGTANTGGGGGGAGFTSAGWWITDSGTGGSGVAILAYPTSSLKSRGGNRKYFDDRVAHIFNSSETLAVGTGTHTHSTLDVFGDSSCKALYQLDSNVNDTGGNYNGTATSITYTQGYINDAAVFGGSSKIDIGASNNFASNKVTISFWFKPTSTISNYKILFSNYTTGAYTDGFLNMSRNTDGTLELGIMAGSGWFFRKTSNSVFTVGTLKHYVVVMDNTESAEGDKVTMYVDGGVVTHANNTNSGTPSGNWLNTSTVLNIGNWVHATGYGESGEFDQIRIFNKALSASEVATLYNE